MSFFWISAQTSPAPFPMGMRTPQRTARIRLMAMWLTARTGPTWDPVSIHMAMPITLRPVIIQASHWIF